MSHATKTVTVSRVVEIPEVLHDAIQAYLDSHPDYDQQRLFTSALSLFLLQNGASSAPESALSYRKAARMYLDSLFQHPLG